MFCNLGNLFCSTTIRIRFFSGWLDLQIEHYLQIVKTEVITRRYSREHSLLEEYEYTAHSSLVQSIYIPAAKFHFELSPMQVE